MEAILTTLGKRVVTKVALKAAAGGIATLHDYFASNPDADATNIIALQALLNAASELILDNGHFTMDCSDELTDALYYLVKLSYNVTEAAKEQWTAVKVKHLYAEVQTIILIPLMLTLHFRISSVGEMHANDLQLAKMDIIASVATVKSDVLAALLQHHANIRAEVDAALQANNAEIQAHMQAHVEDVLARNEAEREARDAGPTAVEVFADLQYDGNHSDLKSQFKKYVQNQESKS